MPGEADSNSPGHWRDGTFYLYNSNGAPIRSQGPNLFELRATRAVLFDTYDRPHRWIESTYIARNGTVYAWYHHEPGLVCQSPPLTAPKIGALISPDGGTSFWDMGIVLESGDPPDCDAKNGYFAGGHGDFTVVADREERFLYFLFSNYGGATERQGISIARIAVEDLDEPVGKVWKYHEGRWDQAGLGGNVSPVLPATVGWQDAKTDSFWGPSVHFNHYLDQYVMLLNRSCCEPGWFQEGVYVSFTPNLGDPESWKTPVKVVHEGNWYPQVIGLLEGESDKHAGKVARFFVGGFSEWEIEFDF